MNPFQIIATLRKFGNYIAGLFPVLAHIVDWLTKPLKAFIALPAVAPHWQRLCDNKIVQSIWNVVSRFYWRDYSKDRLDLSEAPPESLSVMLPVFRLCVLLCLLVPISQLHFGAYVPVEGVSGASENAAVWVIITWMVALSAGWSSILAGSAFSNRIAFAALACSAVYMLSICIVTSERSYWNWTLTFAILLAYFVSENQIKREKIKDWIISIFCALCIGCITGIQLTCTTPLKALLAPLLPFVSYEQVGVVIGCILGSIITLAISLTAKKWKITLDLGNLMTINFCALAVFFAAATIRGDLSKLGSQMFSSLKLFNGYLWPVWYFLGVGIVFKLIGSSKVVSNSIKNLIGPKLLTPVLLVILTGLCLVFGSDYVVRMLGTEPSAVANILGPVFYPIYLNTAPFIWREPLTTIAVHWFSWVLLFDVIVVTVLLIVKRLNNDSMARLFYLNCLSALLIWEYVFQLASFVRTPKHSIFALLIFSLWLLWLMHTVGWSMSLKSSPLWPAIGRLPIYGGIMTFCFLEIFARSALKDFNVTNELFLALFRGVIDIGLPYFFYLYALARLSKLPLHLSSLFTAFCLGALFSFPVNILDKFAATGSIEGLKKICAEQYQLFQVKGSINLDLELPEWWLLTRAVLFVCVLTALALFAHRKNEDANERHGAKVFSLVAFASGMASFSRSFVDLPIPMNWHVFIGPTRQDLFFNAGLIYYYFALWLPSLILGLGLLSDRLRKRPYFFALMAIAAAFNFAISFLYQNHESLLRASGLIYSGVVILLAIFVLLVSYCISEMAAFKEFSQKPKAQPLLTERAIYTLLTVIILALSGLAIYQVSSIHSKEVRVQAFNHPIKVPDGWKEVPTKDPRKAMMTFKDSQGLESQVYMGTLDSNPEGSRALMKDLLIKASASLPNLQLLKIDSWNRMYPDALVCYYSFEKTIPGTSLVQTFEGFTILVPMANNITEYYTLVTSPTDMDRQQWRLAMVVESLPERMGKIPGFN
ncbi:MAG: hypothetical protein KIT34_02630 [Cyanobacteria bacterium TGS_CYA1]|nr:hypothetical protein [Cyanobacteria bacterium TGS_CYA1]